MIHHFQPNIRRNRFLFLGIGAFLFFLLFATRIVFAEDFSSTNFIGRDVTETGGGGFSTSVNFQVWDAIGELSIGNSSSASFEGQSGFLYRVEAANPPPPPPAATPPPSGSSGGGGSGSVTTPVPPPPASPPGGFPPTPPGTPPPPGIFTPPASPAGEPPPGTTPPPSFLASIFDRFYNFIKPILPSFFKPKGDIVIIPQVPLVFLHQWDLIGVRSIREFVFAPLPQELRVLVAKFPRLQEALTQIGVKKLKDLPSLLGVQLHLPRIADILGIASTDINVGPFTIPPNISIRALSPDIKKNIPSEVIFARAADKRLSLSSALIINETGKPEQRITTVVGGTLNLIVKPKGAVQEIRGYMVLKKRVSAPQASLPNDSLLASAFMASAGFTKEKIFNEVTEEFVLQPFMYEDPDGDGIYSADVTVPVVEGEYEIITLITYTDPALGTKELRLTTVVDPEGYVFEAVRGQELRIKDATVSLFAEDPNTNIFALWPAENYFQENPQITNVTGKYSFLVPEGNYYLTVEASGYTTYISKPFLIREGSGVHANIEMKQTGFSMFSDIKVILIVLGLLGGLAFYIRKRRK